MDNDHPLDIPDYLRIPEEARMEARKRYSKASPGPATRFFNTYGFWPEHNPDLAKVRGWMGSATGATPKADNGPGSTCRKAGIPDGINQNLVERMEMLEAVKEAKSKALLYEMDERRKQEKAERESVREAVRKQHKAKRRRRSF